MALRQRDALPDPTLRRVLDIVPVGVAVLLPIDGSADFLYVYANPAFEAISPGIQGRTYLEKWPDDPLGLLPNFRRVIETGERWEGRDRSMTVRRGDGSLDDIHIAYWNSRLDIDGVPHLVSVLRETTDEVRARRQADESLWQLQMIFEHMGDAFIAIDRDWRVTFLNDRAAQYLGITKREGLGRTLWEVVPGLVGTVYETEARRAMEEGIAVAFEAYYPPASMWTEMRLYPSGQGVAIFVTDVTARKEAERERQRAQQQEQSLRTLEQKDRAIRQAYSDVIDAVTGGRLVILGADELDEAMIERPSEDFALTEAAQLGGARAKVKELAGGAPRLDDILLAFSEGATNMLKHAGGGVYRVARNERRIQVILEDSGPGINFHDLPKATLVPGFSTMQTLGMGFSLMMELTDRLLLCTGKTGTTVVLEADLSKTSPRSRSRG